VKSKGTISPRRGRYQRDSGRSREQGKERSTYWVSQGDRGEGGLTRRADVLQQESPERLHGGER